MGGWWVRPPPLPGGVSAMAHRGTGGSVARKMLTDKWVLGGICRRFDHLDPLTAIGGLFTTNGLKAEW